LDYYFHLETQIKKTPTMQPLLWSKFVEEWRLGKASVGILGFESSKMVTWAEALWTFSDVHRRHGSHEGRCCLVSGKDRDVHEKRFKGERVS